MPTNNVDISLQAKQTASTKTTLDKLIKDLKEIKKLSSFELGKDQAEVQKLKKVLESLTSEKEKQNQKDEIRLKLQAKLATAQKNGYANSQKEIQKLIKLNEDDKEITKKKWLTLQKITAEDAKHKKIISDKVSLNKQLISEIDKGNKKAISNQKMLNDAYKMNAEVDRKSYQEKVSKEQQHYEALKRNEALKEKTLNYEISTRSKINKLKEKEVALTAKIASEEKGKTSTQLNKESYQQSPQIKSMKEYYQQEEILSKKKLQTEIQAYAINEKLNKNKLEQLQKIKSEEQKNVSIQLDKESYQKSPEMKSMKEYYQESEVLSKKKLNDEIQAYTINNSMSKKRLSQEHEAYAINKKMSQDKIAKEHEAYAINKKMNQSKIEDLKKQKQLLDTMSVKTKGKEQYSELNTMIGKYNTKLKQNVKLTNDEVRALKLLKSQSDTTKGSVMGLYQAVALVTSAYMVMRRMTGYVSELDKPMYNLGVVAGYSSEQIEEMKLNLLDFSSNIPQSADKIADAMDLIMKTGATYNESMQIIKASTILATSSGKNLCPSKTFLTAGTAYKVIDTKLRQKCA